MSVTLTFLNGDRVTLAFVKAIRLVRHHIVETQTFGNSAVTHADVVSVHVEPFNFDHLEEDIR